MQIKYQELKNFKINSVNYYLLYGANSGLIHETIDKIFKPNSSKNVLNYEEIDILGNVQSFKEQLFNKSFFDNDKLIIIKRASDKILDLIKEIIEKSPEEIKILIISGTLEKKSKLRNYFEKEDKTVIIPFYEDNYQSLLLMVQKTFKEKKINVSNEIINLIIERSRRDRINIANELEKIISYAKVNNKINIKDALKLTNLSENYGISELVDQKLAKNVKKTINILNENNLTPEDNILILRTFINKLKRLKKLKKNIEINNNIEKAFSSLRPPIFWKDKNIIKQQLNMWSLTEINLLLAKVNNLELLIKQNNQISDQILNNFILENSLATNSGA